jgi:cytochrome c-type biogenesis protein CcmE
MSEMKDTALPGTRKPRHRKRFIVAAVLLGLAMAYLGYQTFANSTYSIPPSQIKILSADALERPLRVFGTVVPGTIERSGKPPILTFNVVDTVEDGAPPSTEPALPVVYKGAEVPDAFADGAKVIIEGRYNSNGTFQATKLMVGCPSRYEAKV